MRVMHVFRSPIGGVYTLHTEHREGHLSPLAFPDFSVDAVELLG
jgi:hypothetical protein